MRCTLRRDARSKAWAHGAREEQPTRAARAFSRAHTCPRGARVAAAARTFGCSRGSKSRARRASERRRATRARRGCARGRVCAGLAASRDSQCARSLRNAARRGSVGRGQARAAPRAARSLRARTVVREVERVQRRKAGRDFVNELARDPIDRHRAPCSEPRTARVPTGASFAPTFKPCDG